MKVRIVKLLCLVLFWWFVLFFSLAVYQEQAKTLGNGRLPTALYIPFKTNLWQWQGNLSWELTAFSLEHENYWIQCIFFLLSCGLSHMLCLPLILFAALCWRAGLSNFKPVKTQIHHGKGSLGASDDWTPLVTQGVNNWKDKKERARQVVGDLGFSLQGWWPFLVKSVHLKC